MEMTIEKVHIGNAINLRLVDFHMTQSEFAQRIGMSPQSVSRLLRKSSIETEKLVLISEKLEYNFFKEFTDNYPALSVRNDHTCIFHNDLDDARHDKIIISASEEQIKTQQATIKELHEIISDLIKERREKKSDNSIG